MSASRSGAAVERPRCTHCGLPARGAGAFCCTGCALASQLRRVDGKEGASSDQLLARVLLGAFLSTGVMVVSIAMYGGYLEGGEAAERSSEAARALSGLYRLAALVLSAPIALLIGVPLAQAVLLARRWMSVDVWILLGAGAAFGLSMWNTLVSEGPVYYESASMILVLVGLGRWIDVKAKERARERLERVLPLSRPVANRVVGEAEEAVAPPELAVGDVVRVRPGEPVPVDGRVEQGRAFLDTADLTGESAPRSVGPGGEVLAGSRVLDGTLLVRTEAGVGARVCDAMERLLERAMTSGGAHERRAERLAAWMIPSVLGLALFVFVRGVWAGATEDGVRRALSVLLVACPCALGIATPLAFWSALARTWERHVLVKGSEVLERLARVRRVFFDKTGTLTEGVLELVAVRPASLPGPIDEREALRLAAACEVGSEHPIGEALRRAWQRAGDGRGALPAATDFRAIPGVGVEARIEGRTVALRSAAPEAGSTFTTVGLHVDGTERARFELQDRARAEAPALVAELAAGGLELRVLSGDGQGPVEALARELDVAAEWGLLPHDKVRRIEAVGAAGTLFVGDGMNDAAALAEAEVGIAVHGGSPRSFDAADALLLAPGLSALPELLDLARTAVHTARLNLAWCLVYNLLGVGLAAAGRLNPVLAAAAMVLSGVGVLANTRRAFARFDRPARPESLESAETGSDIRREGLRTSSEEHLRSPALP